MAENPNQQQPLLLNAETVAENARQIEKLTKYYDDLSKKIEDVGFIEAIRQAKEETDAIKNLQKGVGDLSANYSALNKEINDIGTALRESQNIVRDSAKELAKLASEEKNFFNEAMAGAKKLGVEQAATAKELAKALEDNLSKLLENQEAVKKVNELREKEVEFTKLKEKSQEQLSFAEKRDLALLETRIQSLKKEPEVQQIINNQLALLNAKNSQKAELEAKIHKTLIEEAAAMQPLLKFEELRLESVKKTNDGMKGILDKVMLTSTNSNMMATMFIAAQKSIDGVNGGLGTMIGNIKDGITRSFLDPEQAANRFFNLITDRVIKSSFEFDKIAAGVNKATGGFRDSFQEITFGFGGPAISDLAAYGVTVDKYAKTYGDLSKAISGFNNLSATQRKLLADSAASMDALGVSATTFGKTASMFMAAFGKTVEGARDSINQLAKDALALGKSVEEYTTAFEGAMAKISGYGREAISIFKELEAISVATKGVITSQDLLSISDKFQTFDSAAEAVSKLNAMLGGTSVNILDMMRADPAEQIMMIKRSAEEAGLSFNSLNIGYKRLLAEYFGGDIRKAAAFFNADMMEADRLMKQASATEEELQKKKEQSAAAQEKLNALLDNMKIALTPIVEMMGDLASAVGRFLSFPGGPILATIGLISLGFLGLQLALGKIKAAAVDVAARFSGAAMEMKTSVQLVAAEIQHLNAQLFGTAKEAEVAAAKVQMLRNQASMPMGAGGGPGGPAGAPTGGPTTKGSMLKGAGAAIGVMAVIAGAQYFLSDQAQKIRERQEEKQSANKQKEERGLQENPFATSQEVPKQGNDEIRIIRDKNGVPTQQIIPTNNHPSDNFTGMQMPDGSVAVVAKKPGGDLDRGGMSFKNVNNAYSSFSNQTTTTSATNYMSNNLQDLSTARYEMSSQAARSAGGGKIYAAIQIGRDHIKAIANLTGEEQANILGSTDNAYS